MVQYLPVHQNTGADSVGNAAESRFWVAGETLRGAAGGRPCECLRQPVANFIRNGFRFDSTQLIIVVIVRIVSAPERNSQRTRIL